MKNKPPNKSLKVLTFTKVFFYEQTGPIPLQKKFPQLLTVMLDFIKHHGFAAHVRRRSGTSSTCGVRLEDI